VHQVGSVYKITQGCTVNKTSISVKSFKLTNQLLRIISEKIVLFKY
jgi:hypothetical protein